MMTFDSRRKRPCHVGTARSRRARDSDLWRASQEPEREDGLLLDTHAWIWTLDGNAESMAAEALALIESAAEHGRLFASDISFWEVSLKAAKGKLNLAVDPVLWLAKAVAAPGIQGLPLTREVLVQSTLLPGEMHGDPADRMLLAQAQMSGLSLVTCDLHIVDYAGGRPGVPVCDARTHPRGRA